MADALDAVASGPAAFVDAAGFAAVAAFVAAAAVVASGPAVSFDALAVGTRLDVSRVDFAFETSARFAATFAAARANRMS